MHIICSPITEDEKNEEKNPRKIITEFQTVKLSRQVEMILFNCHNHSESMVCALCIRYVRHWGIEND